LGLLAGAGYFARNAWGLITAGEEVAGTVVGFERRSSKGGSTEYPIIEFTTTTGDVRRFTTSGAGDYAKGETVDVLYEAKDPSHAKVDAFFELWLGTLALGGFGLLCLGVGIGTVLYDRARAKAGA
jgi:hypothetical protein